MKEKLQTPEEQANLHECKQPAGIYAKHLIARQHAG